MSKANNRKLDLAYLETRNKNAIAAGYPPLKWVEFATTLMGEGLSCTLYEARRTVSKYITVSDGRRQFKVRFSNHRPIPARELSGDCDFFVGKTNLAVTNTAMALAATRNFFKEPSL